MEKISCKINGENYSAPKGSTILEIANNEGIQIPTLCFLKGVSQSANCRMCVVEVKGMQKLLPACETEIKEGMEIETESSIVLESRKKTLDLMCKHHRMECELCPNYTYCKFHSLLRNHKLDDRNYTKVFYPEKVDRSSNQIVRDDSKCILCRRCVNICNQMGFCAMSAIGRGPQTRIGTNQLIAESDCTGCGQCVVNCPTGALYVKNDTDLIWKAINNNKKIIIAVSPFTANNIGKFFGESSEEDNFLNLKTILEKIGKITVFNTNEFIHLIDNLENKKEYNPVFFSSCPIVIKNSYSNVKISKIERADQIFGTLVKEEFAKQNGNLVNDIFTVYISPCTAIKGENTCDAIITTSELADFIRRACISRFTMNEVWESTKKEISEKVLISNTELSNYSLETQILAKCIKQGKNEKQKLLLTDKINEINVDEYKEYTTVEIVACPGGCKNGGGQFRTV